MCCFGSDKKSSQRNPSDISLDSIACSTRAVGRGSPNISTTNSPSQSRSNTPYRSNSSTPSQSRTNTPQQSRINTPQRSRSNTPHSSKRNSLHQSGTNTPNSYSGSSSSSRISAVDWNEVLEPYRVRQERFNSRLHLAYVKPRR